MRLEARSASSSAISLYEDATDEWLETWIRSVRSPAQHAEVFRRLLNAISPLLRPMLSPGLMANRRRLRPRRCFGLIVMGLFDLLVDPEHRGQGFGSGLLEASPQLGI